MKLNAHFFRIDLDELPWHKFAFSFHQIGFILKNSLFMNYEIILMPMMYTLCTLSYH